MTDQAKRKTLKAMAMGGAGIAAGTMGSLAMASNSIVQGDDSFVPLAELTVKVSHSWTADDVKVEIINETRHPVTITQMTPSSVSNHAGVINFESLLKQGPLTIAPQSQVNIGLEPYKGVRQYDSESGKSAQLMQRAIVNNLSVITDNEAFAAVTTIFDPRIV